MRGIIIGAAPGFDPELLNSHVRPEDYVICADGGYDYALRAGIVPNVFLGDMDSVHSQDRLPCDPSESPKGRYGFLYCGARGAGGRLPGISFICCDWRAVGS